MRDPAIPPVSKERGGADSQRVSLIEPVKQASAVAVANGSAACASCRHRYCSNCEQCSVAKQSSDYWICHRCGELNQR
jgi:hypothetical protein